MSRQDHLITLQKKHDQLDQYIRTEIKRPLPNTAYLNHLKRRKLQLKDRMEALLTRY